MTTILPRRGTAAEWTAANPVLAMGELGFETDTKKWKRGDGTTAWTALAYDYATADQGARADKAQPAIPVGYYTPTGKPDGAVAEMDSGQVVATFGNSPGAVVGGEIVHTPASPTSSASYYQINAGARIHRIGCEVKWAAGSIGALTLVLPVSAWGPPGGFPADSAAQVSAGVHLVMYGNGVWHCSRFNQPGATETTYAEYTTHGRYADVRDGQFRKVELWIDTDNGSATLLFPDGGVTQFSHTAIKDDTSNWAVWEQFENNNADAPCVLRNLWVDTPPRRIDSPVATRADIVEILRSSGAGEWGYTTTISSATTKTLTADSTVIQQVTGSAAQTMVLPSTGFSAGGIFLINNASTGVLTVNSSNGTLVGALASGNTMLVFATVSGPTLGSHWTPIIFATVNTSQSLSNKTTTDLKNTISINAQTGTSYTFVLTDRNKLVTLNNASPVTLTVPLNSSVYIPNGTEFDITQIGVGQVTITPQAGVTVNSTPGLKIAAQYGRAHLVKIATDTWLVSGDLAA